MSACTLKKKLWMSLPTSDNSPGLSSGIGGGTVNGGELAPSNIDQGHFKNCGIYSVLWNIAWKVDLLNSHIPPSCRVHERPFDVQQAAQQVSDWGLLNDEGKLVKHHGTTIPALVKAMNEAFRSRHFKGFDGAQIHVGHIKWADVTHHFSEGKANNSALGYGYERAIDREGEKVTRGFDGRLCPDVVRCCAPGGETFGHFTNATTYAFDDGDFGILVWNSWGDSVPFTVPAPEKHVIFSKVTHAFQLKIDHLKVIYPRKPERNQTYDLGKFASVWSEHDGVITKRNVSGNTDAYFKK